MSKYISKKLLIVESPAKCKKIEGFLGSGYKVIASYGHLTELNSLKNIDVNNYNAKYTIINNSLKRKQIDIIRKEISTHDEVILASDDDREGEAIAWHICQIFHLDVNTTKRITFNEITETAIKKALLNPTIINMDLVHAQQTRQILDLVVGFKISPVLWKCIHSYSSNSLSAGRCQTPALKIIYDNYITIKEAKHEYLYNTTGYFSKMNLGFTLNKQFDNKEEVIDFLDGSADFAHKMNCSKPTLSIKKPPEPFTTSRLQQCASNEFRYSPKETMKICQKLYEAGLITYMRTDSKCYSKDFIDSVKKYIDKNYSPKDQYINPNIEDLISNGKPEPTSSNKKSKKEKEKGNKLAQEAHESIRPTDISKTEIASTFDAKEKKMYRLIWSNCLESCMAPATFHVIHAEIKAFTDNLFTFNTEKIHFPGWKIVTKKYDTDNKEYNYLSNLQPNFEVKYNKIKSSLTVKNIKQHYTEAKLVSLLEDKGIGRPSTFSMLVDKIQERGYVKKEDVKGNEINVSDYELLDDEINEIESKKEFGNEKNKLVIQPLGIIVIEFLIKNFQDIFNYDYTKNLELDLDLISKGEKSKSEICKLCDNHIDKQISIMNEVNKYEIKIDEDNSYIIGKYGPVIKTLTEENNKKVVSYKKVKKDIDMKKLENKEYSVTDIIDNTSKCSSDQILGTIDDKDIYIKNGKFGLYLLWGTKTISLKSLPNKNINEIKLEDVKEYLNENKMVREINKELSIRIGPKGDYIFYKPLKAKKPKFFDIKHFQLETNQEYQTCDSSILLTWIKDKYKI